MGAAAWASIEYIEFVVAVVVQQGEKKQDYFFCNLFWKCGYGSLATIFILYITAIKISAKPSYILDMWKEQESLTTWLCAIFRINLD